MLRSRNFGEAKEISTSVKNATISSKIKETSMNLEIFQTSEKRGENKEK